MLFLASCAESNPIDRSSSVIKDNVVVENDFDKWLGAKFLKPYNIEVKYKFEDNESDRRYNLAPADYSKSVQLAHLLKYLGLEPYDDVTGSQQFIRELFPKVVSFIGSAAYQTNGSMVLGTAEGGRKMTLYRVNNLRTDRPAELNDMYFHTIHHEFGHIQNQTKPYPVEFEKISSKEYVSDSWSSKWRTPDDTRATVQRELLQSAGEQVRKADSLLNEFNTLSAIAAANRTQAQRTRMAEIRTTYLALVATPEYIAQNRVYQTILSVLSSLSVSDINALRAGFISPYASSQHGEDFVELQAFYTTDAPTTWQARLAIAGASGRAIILQKFQIVRDYLQNEWGINIDQLRDNVLKRQAELGSQDLNSLTIN